MELEYLIPTIWLFALAGIVGYTERAGVAGRAMKTSPLDGPLLFILLVCLSVALSGGVWYYYHQRLLREATPSSYEETSKQVLVRVYGNTEKGDCFILVATDKTQCSVSEAEWLQSVVFQPFTCLWHKP